MSMVGLALRLSAVKALRSQTLAGDRVFDSAVLPVDKLTNKMPEPFISVSTEDETGKPNGRDINNGDRTIDLVIEIAIAQTIALPDGEGNGIQVSDTDGNLELSLAVLSRQIDACLWGRGGGVWGDVFRAFAKTINEVGSRRGLPTENGERFAARQIVYRIQAFAEPAFDALEAATPFGKFVAALEGESGLEGIAKIIRNSIEGKQVGWPEVFTTTALNAGLTDEEAQRIGISINTDPESEPVEALLIEPDGIVIDQSSTDTALPPEPLP